MWFPIDQPDYQAAHPDELAATEALLDPAKWKDDDAVPPFTDDYDDVVDHLPANFDDDLLTSRPATASGAGTSSTGSRATSPRPTSEQWRRQLDYYVQAPPARRRVARHGARPRSSAAARGTTP